MFTYVDDKDCSMNTQLSWTYQTVSLPFKTN